MRSPFYDPTGDEMKPLARLYITRQRLYEKSCLDDEVKASQETPEEESGEQSKRIQDLLIICKLHTHITYICGV